MVCFKRLVSAMAQCWHRWAGAWNRFWFTPADPTKLAAIRICTGLILFYMYLACLPQTLEFIGPNAWIDDAGVAQLRQFGGAGSNAGIWWGQSIWFHVQSPALVWTGQALFLVAIACFTAGLFTRIMNVLVWIGHLSFVHRSVIAWFGLDTVLAMLTFYLMFAPTGAALSLDRRRLRNRQGLTQSDAPPNPSWTANLIIRLIQIHVCVIYLCAGLSKLQGERWWDGTAVWRVMMLHEFALFDLSWLAHAGDVVCLCVSTFGVALTLFMEISFAFLIWNPAWRRTLLLLAVLLHGGIGVVMGMASFGAAMLTGCLSFVTPQSLDRFLDRCRRTLRSRAAAPIPTAQAFQLQPGTKRAA